MTAIPIPRRMAHLDRDHRGYPIPVQVLRDQSGRAHFTINDEAVRQRLFAEDKCPICGGLLTRKRWFVGGPLSAFHPMGRYIDLPMHDECCRYALLACPYLAAPSYSKRIDAATLPADNPTPLLLDQTMIPERPDFFVAVLCNGSRAYGEGSHVSYLAPLKPYLRIEFWRHGKQLTKFEGERLARAILEKELPEPQSPRLIDRN